MIQSILENIKRGGSQLEVMVYEKLYDFVALLRGLNVLMNPAIGIVNCGVALVDMAITLCNVIDYLLGLIAFTQDIGVYSEIGNRVMCHDDIRWYMSVDAATTLYETPLADMETLMDYYTRREN